MFFDHHVQQAFARPFRIVARHPPLPFGEANRLCLGLQIKPTQQPFEMDLQFRDVRLPSCASCCNRANGSSAGYMNRSSNQVPSWSTSGVWLPTCLPMRLIQSGPVPEDCGTKEFSARRLPFAWHRGAELPCNRTLICAVENIAQQRVWDTSRRIRLTNRKTLAVNMILTLWWEV